MSARQESPAAREVRITRGTARQLLDMYGDVDIHNHAAVIEGYAALRASLQRLLADLDTAEAGR